MFTLKIHAPYLRSAHKSQAIWSFVVSTISMIIMSCAPMPADHAHSAKSTYQRITNYISTGKPEKVSPSFDQNSSSSQNDTQSQKNTGGFWPFYRVEQAKNNVTPFEAPVNSSLSTPNAIMASDIAGEIPQVATPAEITQNTTTSISMQTPDSLNERLNQKPTLLALLHETVGLGKSSNTRSQDTNNNSSSQNTLNTPTAATSELTQWPKKPEQRTLNLNVDSPLVDTAQQLRNMPANASIASLYSGRFQPKNSSPETATIEDKEATGFSALWNRFTTVFGKADTDNKNSDTTGSLTTKTTPRAQTTLQPLAAVPTTPTTQSDHAFTNGVTPSSTTPSSAIPNTEQQSIVPLNTETQISTETDANLSTGITSSETATTTSTNSRNSGTPTNHSTQQDIIKPTVKPTHPVDKAPSSSPQLSAIKPLPNKNSLVKNKDAQATYKQTTFKKANTREFSSKSQTSAVTTSKNSAVKPNITPNADPIIITALDLTVTNLSNNNDDNQDTSISMDERDLAYVTKGALENTSSYQFLSPEMAKNLLKPKTSTTSITDSGETKDTTLFSRFKKKKDPVDSMNDFKPLLNNQHQNSTTHPKTMTLLHHIIIRKDTIWDPASSSQHTVPQAVLLMKLKDNETGVHLTDTRRTIELSPEQIHSSQSIKKALAPLVTDMLVELAVNTHAFINPNNNVTDTTNSQSHPPQYPPKSDEHTHSNHSRKFDPHETSRPSDTQDASPNALKPGDGPRSHVIDLTSSALKASTHQEKSERFQMITSVPEKKSTGLTNKPSNSNLPNTQQVLSKSSEPPPVSELEKIRQQLQANHARASKKSQSLNTSNNHSTPAQKAILNTDPFYSIQLHRSSTLNYLKDYVNQLSLDQSKVNIIRQNAGNRVRYIAIYGHFSSVGEAQKTLHLLPEDVLSEGAFVRRIDLDRKKPKAI